MRYCRNVLGTPEATFAKRLLAWHDEHGRHDLPWQHPRSAYRVWLSEVMLQQTQVATVIPYFERFTGRYATLAALAQAPLDDVMALWAGLGYYSRARNLHATARLCMQNHDGELPTAFDALLALPGIGRSTAGAILALSRGQRHGILDANVKRVLARYHAIAGWPGKAAIGKRLWQLTDRHTPARRVADYTQAIMDLGATLCTPRQPACAQCPLTDDCRARIAGTPEQYPAKRPPRERPQRHVYMLLRHDDEGAVLLERRPPSGIWGGLWSLPQTETVPSGEVFLGPRIRHGFTHFRLFMTPVLIAKDGLRSTVRETAPQRWCTPAEIGALGLPQPVARLIKNYFAGQIPWQEPCIA